MRKVTPGGRCHRSVRLRKKRMNGLVKCRSIASIFRDIYVPRMRASMGQSTFWQRLEELRAMKE